MMRDLGFAVKPVLTIDAKATEHFSPQARNWEVQAQRCGYRTRSDPRHCDCAESGAKNNVADLGTKPLSKTVSTKHCLTLGYANMDEENVEIGWQVLAMFWDLSSAVSSQRQAAGDHVQKSASRDPQQQSNCRIRSSSSEHREIARDVKEDVALHCLGL